MTRSTYVVTGMTCGHCVASVKEEVGELPGVRDVDVDLNSGRVLVTSEGVLAPERIEGAVQVAGYRLVR
ncbi:heavy-metal-associated domain-containing protein [Amycolatopsis sp. FBCC-B4732]|uniref:heavy-metal-associated domain-containing protein n=1 Tax=Amycolatopsis sp. FBCC-B4732 TaxID=3079339 RepID=UPI001FF58F04|nr:heavy-metal-associated domain-containing protein [Amycolatopsis sp. FBCC-B4732]UOX90780.1 heavy-metal-associated domain-containing protein [Amycolatopsis sp. FBCC-B4732]